MVSKYVTIALRHFVRYKKYTLINIGGLSVGLAVSMFILLWMADEWREDKFHKDGNRIYRVFNNYTQSDGSVTTGYYSQGPLAEAVLAEIPEAEQSIRVSRFYEASFQHENISFNESGHYADPGFFEMFTFPLIKGNPLSPLPDKNSVAISRSMADKFFKNGAVIGKILKVDKTHDLRITAVFQDPPESSSLKFDYIIPFEALLDDSPWLKEWNNNSLFTYIKLKEGASPEQANKKLNAIFQKNCSACKNNSFLFLFKDLHLYGQFENGKAVGGRIEYVKIFSIAALFIILMACANFTNLATAQASTRWREVGVRKVVGAERRSLVLQFTGESLLLSVISFFFAILIVEQSLPFFNELTHKKISFLGDRSILMSFTAITVLTGLLAGIYPALYLSSIKPVQALKGMGLSGGSLTGLRKGLVIFQFTLSAILMAASFTVYQQINFIRSKHLGFEKDNILTFTLSDEAMNNLEVIKTRAKQIPGVESIGVANHRPFRVTRFWNDVSWPGKLKDQIVSFDVMSCDEDFIPTLKMEIAQGRNFTSDLSEAKNFLINEKAAAVMGLENPVGTALITSTEEGKIIGVVKDFHHTNLRSPIGPLIITLSPRNRFVFVRINNLAMESTIEQLHRLCKAHNPDSPFQYQWLNESFDQEYENENLMGTLSLSFAVIAIFISCIGLFGLVSFTMERRSKEISIRKVMGASIFRLWQMLSKDFVMLVIGSCLVAIPVSWYLLNQWLQKYAYRTDISWWIFGVAGGSILLITLLTVSFQSIKAAVANPVTSLRNE